ncbi:MAG TPA: dihydrolipoamide acetyltransferase family protein [Acidobacteriota bacterium]|jgi:pyruvate dehydrogenase E2 component (dihydrolipoamide acetyltransferase)|nr:dihydrolipoamide acetyltransferase family protein [Acidobacteriota bacterium]|tara:strand:- start:4622 stop:5917 length:1296 start_codon:yes stop_codon:yes gene_type:complete
MSDEFKLPDIGEGLAEGEIVKWLVAVGDTVDEDQPLVEVMTDKATVEIPSPRAGTVAKLNAAEGDVVQIGTTILLFGDGVDAVANEAAVTDVDASPAVTSDDLKQARELARAERDAAEASRSDRPVGEKKPAGVAAPAARRLATELGVDIDKITGSGPGGLVTKGDVRSSADGAAQAPESGSRGDTVDSTAQDGPLAAPTVPDVSEERIALKGLRRTIAERMLIAKTTVPHYTYVEEVDMSEVVTLRREGKSQAAEQGIKLTYLPFIIRALVLALKDHPYLNASLDEDSGEIVLKHYYNVGVATATDRGLMVPVVKDADSMDLFELASEITRLSDAARDGKIALEDLQGGTFTITSTGNIGGFLATPVINVPEVAILGITSIRERPVVMNGEIVIRHMLNLSLSCDHRVVDGAVAALFVRDLVKFLEDPGV